MEEAIMKITIQPTAPQEGEKYPYPTVSIEMPEDDITLPKVMENLIRPALIAWGFEPTIIEEYIEPS
jgi:hypothetical protein